EWGRKNRVGRLSPEDQARVQLLESDVMTVETPPVDVIAALNFSYFIFDTRDRMRTYFKRCYDALTDDGVLFLDMYGGPEAQEETKEKTKYKNFTYIWYQAEFHPVTHYVRCHIHFKFPDGSKIKKAFSYEWRLWTAPEIRELLLEAGFKKATVYWEGEDEDGEGNGEVTPDEKGVAALAWIAYVVAEKGAPVAGAPCDPSLGLRFLFETKACVGFLNLFIVWGWHPRRAPRGGAAVV